jgi:hypothetical protein
MFKLLTASAMARPSRSVEGGEKTIASGVDLAAAMTLELLAHEEVVMTDKLFPCTVADLGCPLGCADDIGEEHCGENAIWLGTYAHARQKSLNLVTERVDAPCPR